MIVLGVVLGLLILAGMFGAGMLFGYQRGLRAHVCEPQVFVAPAPASRQLELSREQVRVRDDLIHMLSTVEVVPVSPYMELPWQVVPSPARTFWVQGLVDRIQDLEDEAAERESDLTYFVELAAKRWRWLKAARQRVRELTPVVADIPLMYADFERECGLKDGYHGLARSFAERITNAREAIASEAMRDEIDSILGGNVLSFPVRERQAA